MCMYLSLKNETKTLDLDYCSTKSKIPFIEMRKAGSNRQNMSFWLVENLIIPIVVRGRILIDNTGKLSKRSKSWSSSRKKKEEKTEMVSRGREGRRKIPFSNPKTFLPTNDTLRLSMQKRLGEYFPHLSLFLISSVPISQAHTSPFVSSTPFHNNYYAQSLHVFQLLRTRLLHLIIIIMLRVFMFSNSWELGFWTLFPALFLLSVHPSKASVPPTVLLPHLPFLVLFFKGLIFFSFQLNYYYYFFLLLFYFPWKQTLYQSILICPQAWKMIIKRKFPKPM